MSNNHFGHAFVKKNIMLKNHLNLNAIRNAAIMVAAMWFGYFLQYMGWFTGCSGAIIPLNPHGLKGIFLSPFLHGSLEHIFGNSVPIFVLVFLLYQFYPFIAKKVFLLGWILTGFLVWLLPPIDIYTGEFNTVCIIGASGIVYVLAFFIFFQRRIPVEHEILNRVFGCCAVLWKFNLGRIAGRIIF